MQMFIEGSVICDLKNREKYAAIHELLTKAPVFRKIKDISLFEKVVVERERKLSTGLGHGVAFAHGKTDTVDKLYVACGISKQGIEYEALDGKPVYLLFLVANPPDGHADYLKLISALSRIVRNDEFRENMISITDPEKAELEFRRAIDSQLQNC